MNLYLDTCLEHDGCVAYFCVRDGVELWRSHIGADTNVLSVLNGSYDTVDLRSNTVLAKEDYASQVVEAAGDDGVLGTSDDVVSRSWWKPWTWKG